MSRFALLLSLIALQSLSGVQGRSWSLDLCTSEECGCHELSQEAGDASESHCPCSKTENPVTFLLPAGTPEAPCCIAVETRALPFHAPFEQIRGSELELGDLQIQVLPRPSLRPEIPSGSNPLIHRGAPPPDPQQRQSKLRVWIL